MLYARMESGSTPLRREHLRLDLLIEALAPPEAGLVLEGGPTECAVDPKLFGILLRNLFQNALRHGAAAKSGIHIRLDPDTLHYEDRGPGFPAAVLRSFSSGQGFLSSQGGVGLGLTIQRMIVEAHGGRMHVENSAEGGARIDFHGFSR